ncbi:TetR/AcrR family transcriptional regulator [Actinocatenispora sera]|uniref:TetR family transcriptional regulator n=1 Tax=Actinocatenispora sera TaxID=390989 RepID=A0A810L791_9ACTN|nr:TetR/AcrR family transcriptional regulator [Actinocatenispora sera]BCJ31394.1 TetR family transcriptional regulator [Actinocatenispora sera]
MSPRADAARNRARVLEAAQEVFAAEGLGASTEQIARRAGVGVGTVFRHFPTKEALLSAVLAARLETLADEAERLAADGDPGTALFDFLARTVEASGPKVAYADALERAGIGTDQVVAPVRGRVTKAVGVLLERAQQAGAVRDDVAVAQVFVFIHGASRAVPTIADDGVRAATLRMMFDGLRPR